ncbi:helicase-associated domain-containing protein [Subtercola sp. RTI3]|uniref:helicase-associated domain-containing protein n=1 Tax=Subtercola sp. RTI3 TaxID=3048639 RepID=UPI002B236340|nr:helicase-associated domain-containing protein [Subtercola sp. RTI3]MEA9986385.1 helicase-associated domain-containing protein [Subtercola sp. RTI3]
MSDTLALASRLQSESDAALITLLTGRHLSKRDLRDFFDLADALLTPESVQDALSRLDRPTLAAIAAGTTPRSSASPELLRAFAAMLLIDIDGVLKPYDAVAAVLESWPGSSLPSPAELGSVEAPRAAAPPSTHTRSNTDQLSAERAFETTVAVTEVVNALHLSPARELAKGGLAVPDAKRLAAVTGFEPDQMNAVLRVAATAGLAVRDGSSWFASAGSRAWLLTPMAERWGALAGSWLAELPESIVAVLRTRIDAVWGESLAAYLRWLYPAGGAALDAQIAELGDDSERLGIAIDGVASSAGTALLCESVQAAVALIAPLLPPEVETVYLQHDLTVVAAGPLRPDIDSTLRAMAQLENHSIASSYRISGGSIARALGAGYTAAGIRSFLGSISSTGIPQPLDYLISESSARYGLLRVGTLDDAPAAGTYVRSDDGELLHTIAVDQNLGSLGLVFTENNRLTSHFSLDTVYWMLVDARYPVIAEGSHGDPVTLARIPVVVPTALPSNRLVDELINRLRGSGVSPGVDTAEAWLVRQLDVAVKAKTPVLVTVRLPNGDEVSFPVVPTSVASGRMRGTDQKAGVERTLPLASITQVQTVSPVS